MSMKRIKPRHTRGRRSAPYSVLLIALFAIVEFHSVSLWRTTITKEVHDDKKNIIPLYNAVPDSSGIPSPPGLHDVVSPSPHSPAFNYLRQVVENRKPKCSLKAMNTMILQEAEHHHNDNKETNTTDVVIVSLLAVARAGSTTLTKKIRSTRQEQQERFEHDMNMGMVDDEDNGAILSIFSHHQHDCALRDFEESIKDIGIGHQQHNSKIKNFRLHIIVSLRHPLARISSGISRRMEGKVTKKKSNALIVDNFVKKGSDSDGDTVHVAEKFVHALRNESDPLHDIALEATLGHDRQNYMTPVSEFYLADSTYYDSLPTSTSASASASASAINVNTKVKFVCIDTLDDDYDAALQGWFPTSFSATARERASQTESKISSGNFHTVLSRFSKDSIDWVERTYAKDVALYKEYCPEGYRKYTESKMDIFAGRKR